MASSTSAVDVGRKTTSVKVLGFQTIPKRKTVVVHGEITIEVEVTSDTEVLTEEECRYTEEFKKEVHLVGPIGDAEDVARHIVSKYPYIKETLFPKLVEAVESIQTFSESEEAKTVWTSANDPDPQHHYYYGHGGEDGGPRIPRFPDLIDEFTAEERCEIYTNTSLMTEVADISRLEHYIELLYEELHRKIESTTCLAKLVQSKREDLVTISNHKTLMNAVTRTLREDSKKSLSLSNNIFTIYTAMAKIKNYHPILIDQLKIPALALDIIDFELERCEKWQVQLVEMQAAVSDLKIVTNRTQSDCYKMWIKLEELTTSQNGVLKGAFETLHYLSEDKLVCETLVQKGIVNSLCASLRRKDKELQGILVEYLFSLSCYKVCVESMLAGDLVTTLVEMIKKGEVLPKKVIKSIHQLFYNLSFHSEARDALIEAELSTLPACFKMPKFQEVVGSIFYLLSMDRENREYLAKPSIIEILVEFLVNKDGEIRYDSASKPLDKTKVMYSLAVNLAKCPRGALLMWESAEFVDFIQRALAEEDDLGVKVLKNMVAQDPSAYTLHAAVNDFGKAIIASSKRDFVIECVGLLAVFDITTVSLDDMSQGGKVYPWMRQTLAFYADRKGKGLLTSSSKESEKEKDLQEWAVSNALMYLINVSTVEDGSRMVVQQGLPEPCLKILNAELAPDEKSEMPIFDLVISLFNEWTQHEPIAHYFVTKTKIPNSLLELAESCGATDGGSMEKCLGPLDNIGLYDEMWKDNVQTFRFQYWNKEWVDAVSTSTTVGDSTSYTKFLSQPKKHSDYLQELWDQIDSNKKESYNAKPIIDSDISSEPESNGEEDDTSDDELLKV